MKSTNETSDESISEEKLIILDIDETLLHAATSPLGIGVDHKTARTFIYKRPHVDEFLNFCGKHFRVAVWTTASAAFAEEIFSRVFKLNYALEFLWSASHCSDQRGIGDVYDYPCKNLMKLEKIGYCLKDISMIDDTPEKLRQTPRNLMQVKAFRGDKDDDELNFLAPYLLTLKSANDICAIEKTNWKHGISIAETESW